MSTDIHITLLGPSLVCCVLSPQMVVGSSSQQTNKRIKNMNNAISVVDANREVMVKQLDSIHVKKTVTKTGQMGWKWHSKSEWLAECSDPTWSSNEKRRRYNEYRAAVAATMKAASDAAITLEKHITGSVRRFKNGNIVTTHIHPDNQKVKAPKRKGKLLEITPEIAHKTASKMTPEAKRIMIEACS